MIQRFDYCDIGDGLGHNWKEMKESEQGDFVLYEDHLAKIAALKTENKRLEESLIYYVKESYKAETEAKRLRNALIEITDYPEERMTCEIAEEALKEQP